VEQIPRFVPLLIEKSIHMQRMLQDLSKDPEFRAVWMDAIYCFVRLSPRNDELWWHQYHPVLQRLQMVISQRAPLLARWWGSHLPKWIFALIYREIKLSASPLQLRTERLSPHSSIKWVLRPHAAAARCRHCGRFLRWLSTRTPGERQARRQQGRPQAMTARPPSEAQLAYVAVLGDAGSVPSTMAEGPASIHTLVRGEG
jgi:hypothetical protein